MLICDSIRKFRQPPPSHTKKTIAVTLLEKKPCLKLSLQCCAVSVFIYKINLYFSILVFIIAWFKISPWSNFGSKSVVKYFYWIVWPGKCANQTTLLVHLQILLECFILFDLQFWAKNLNNLNERKSVIEMLKISNLFQAPSP